MADIPLAQLFLTTVLANNFVLVMFLGLCPFLGVSGWLATAAPMGAATTFVMLVVSLCAYGLNALLTWLGLEFLRLIAYIAVIASAAQRVEMVLKKYEKVQPGPVPRLGHLSAADHHQLRHLRRGAVADRASTASSSRSPSPPAATPSTSARRLHRMPAC